MANHQDQQDGLFSIMWDLWRSSLPQVVNRSELWFFCGINLATWGAFQLEYGWLQRSTEGVNFDIGSKISVDWVDLKMLTMISTILLAFYVHQCFERYQLIRSLTTHMLSSTHDVAFQARLFLKPTAAKLCSRWVALTALLTLTEGPSIRAWRKLVAHGFVKRYEAEPLRRMGPARRWLLLQQVTQLLAKEVNEHAFGQMLGRILAMKDRQQEILEMKKLSSLPFKYHHLLTVVIMVNLLLLSYGSALTSSCLGPPVFFMVVTFFFGMMEVAVQLRDPLVEESRLQVPKLIEDFLLSMHALIYYEHDGPSEKWQSDLKEEQSQPCEFLVPPDFPLGGA